MDRFDNPIELLDKIRWDASTFLERQGINSFSWSGWTIYRRISDSDLSTPRSVEYRGAFLHKLGIASKDDHGTH